MTFSDTGPDTSCREPAAEQPPRHLTGGAMRQARYRAKRQLRSTDLPAEFLQRVGRLCAEMSLSTHAVLALAVDLLEERRRSEQPKSPTPRRQRPDAARSPETPEPLQQELF